MSWDNVRAWLAGQPQADFNVFVIIQDLLAERDDMMAFLQKAYKMFAVLNRQKSGLGEVQAEFDAVKAAWQALDAAMKAEIKG